MLVGATTATFVTQATGSPVLGGIAAIASHFAMDMVPHLDHPVDSKHNADGELIWDAAIWTQVVIDNGLGLAMLIYFWVTQFGYPSATPFIIGGLGGILPDLIDNVPFWKHFLRRLPGFKQLHVFHEWTHDIWQKRFPMTRYAWLGIVTQMIAVGLTVWYLF